MRSIFILVVAASLGLSSAAYAESRSLGVPNDKGWQHAQTGIILMSKLGAFQRTDLRDNGTSELDISAAYHGVNPADTASIYLFRPGIASLPMWFDRSHYAMTVNPEIRVGAPLGSIARLALPGSNIESGLRVSYALKDSDEGGTGLAMVPFGDWLIAIRLSSPTMTATEVDAGLLDLVAKIRWPAQPTSGQIVAVPVVACTTSLKTHKAKLIQPDLAQALIGASLSHLADKKAREQSASVRPATYCRQGVSVAEYGMYRSDVATDGYILALGDAGIAASVFPGLSLNNRKEYAVTLTTHDSHDTYPSFNALPDPKQVFTLVTSRGPVSRTNRGGSDIVIAPTGK